MSIRLIPKLTYEAKNLGQNCPPIKMENIKQSKTNKKIRATLIGGSASDNGGFAQVEISL